MGGKAAPKTESTTKVDMSPEQREIYNLALPYIRDYAGKNPEYYKGKTIADFTPDQLEAQKKYRGAVPTVDDLAKRSADSQKFMLSTDQLDHRTNPYISGIADQMSEKIRNNLVQTVMPQLRGTAIQGGGMYAGGSTRGQMAERFAADDAVKSTGDALNNLYFNNYKEGLQNIQRAQQLNPQIMAQQLFGANILEAVGGQNQAMDQAKLNDAARRWQMEYYMPYMRSAELINLLQGIPGGQSHTTATGATPSSNPWMSGLGGAASGAAIGSMIPGIGTMIGAGLGGLTGFLGSRYG